MFNLSWGGPNVIQAIGFGQIEFNKDTSLPTAGWF
jgi:hypothetical protein